jgi:hypothetical protein
LGNTHFLIVPVTPSGSLDHAGPFRLQPTSSFEARLQPKVTTSDLRSEVPRSGAQNYARDLTPKVGSGDCRPFTYNQPSAARCNTSDGPRMVSEDDTGNVRPVNRGRSLVSNAGNQKLFCGEPCARKRRMAEVYWSVQHGHAYPRVANGFSPQGDEPGKQAGQLVPSIEVRESESRHARSVYPAPNRQRTYQRSADRFSPSSFRKTWS